MVTAAPYAVYMLFQAMFSKDSSPSTLSWETVVFAFCGALLSYVAIECNVTGLQRCKSGLASQAEYSGMMVPFIFDVLALNRSFLKTDWIAILLIFTLQGVMVVKKINQKDN